ncbi:MAG: methyltransferase, TIGR04325 family, partial [Bacteroidetes bacterium]|nr:methyltransferase, TIGR04325 family [Bacteroidota bacterium]
MMHFLIRSYRRFRYMRYGWFGNYPSWGAVKKEAEGYDAGGILQKILTGAKKVKNGEAVWERDGVLLAEIEYSWPLLAHLLWVAEQKQGRLSVLDFGGGLGTAWFQNRAYLDQEKTQWSVVEQEAFVKAGREEIAGGSLQFYPAIDDAIASRGRHDVLLLGCVLPYLEKPYDFLAGAMQK